MSSNQKEHERLLEAPDEAPQCGGEMVIYTRRWYILFLYCFVSFMQCILYNTYGPIQETVRAVYHWQDYQIDLIAAWGSIAFCITMVPFAWLMDVKGLRVSVLLAAFLQLLGAALRCIPINNYSTLYTGLVHCGQILVNLAGPVSMAVPPLLSSTWFPPNQRTTATAVMSAYVGVAASFIIAPAFVDDVSSLDLPKFNDYYVLNSTLRGVYKKQIDRLLYVEAGAMLVVFLAVLIYFPAKPPTPPSLSAASDRVDFKNGLKTLLKDYNFLLLVFVYGAYTGLHGGWMGVLDQCLSEFGLPVDQSFAGWLGFVAVISGSVSGIGFSVLADHFSGHLKLFLIIFLALAFYFMLMICFVFIKVIPFSEILLYILFGAVGFFVYGTIPFFFEFSVETSYPVAEGVTSGVATFTNNFLQSIFLIVPLGHLGSKWMIWATVVTFAITTTSLLFVKEIYKRSAVDKTRGLLSSNVAVNI